MSVQISFVTVNFNGLRDTIELIETIHHYLPSIYEIIVVDNASQEDELSVIKDRFPEVRCVQSNINLGFAGGNNLGIRQAIGKYVMLINNDAVLTDDSVLRLVQVLDDRSEVGAVSPKILFASEPSCIQYAGYSSMTRFTIRNRTIGYGERDKGQYDCSGPVAFLHGAAMMFRREIISTVGHMPEVFFLYYEEMDWCSAISRKGYILWYESACCVFHKESRSVGLSSPLKVYYQFRNRMLYAWRNRSGMTRWLAVLYLLFVVLPRTAIPYLMHGRLDLVSAVFKGGVNFVLLRNKVINSS